jgi:BirA family transcriptional regulator, biotin operon repressor / biotin---[acetyl-CoA-carboxylase] ligase
VIRYRVFRHDRVDSTNERAFESLALGLAQHGDVHWALEQTAGRGRRGATWHSARGEGLYLSVVLLPAAPLHPVALTMAGGVAVERALRSLGARDLVLKWPNDVLARGAKLAGVLVETRGLDPKRPHYVVGVGVNVLQRQFPAELLAERSVTSLAELGVRASLESARDAVLNELARELERVRAPATELIGDYLAATGLLGRRVEVEIDSGAQAGELVGLTLEFGLELVRDDGSRIRLAVEHVRHVRALD